MTQLKWDPIHFLHYFENNPIVDEYETFYKYQIDRDNLRLLVMVWQHEGVVELSLCQASTSIAIFGFASFVRGGVKYVNDKRGSYIELVDSVIGPNRFWYQSVGNVFDHNEFPHGLNVQVKVSPEIGVCMTPVQTV